MKLLLLLGLSMACAAFWANNHRINQCNRFILDSKTYIQKHYDLPLKSVADIILSEGHYILNNRNYLTYPVDAFLSGFLIQQEYCVRSDGPSAVHMEVDVRVTMQNPIYAIVADTYEELFDSHYRTVYGALDYLLAIGFKYRQPPINKLKLEPIDISLAVKTTDILDMPTPTAIVLDNASDQNNAWYLLLFITLCLFTSVASAFLIYHLKKQGCQSKNDTDSPAMSFNVATDEVTPTVKEALFSSI